MVGAHGRTPAGHLEYGESLEACALREVWEEVRIVIDRVAFHAASNDLFAERNVHYLTVWITGQYASGEVTIHSRHELSAVGWFSHDDLTAPLFLPFANLLAGRKYPHGAG